MRPRENRAGPAARDLRAALGLAGGGAACDFIEAAGTFAPDAAAGDFAASHAGPPARPVNGDEPAVLYRLKKGGRLLFGTYGNERQVRSWLPGLPARIAPDTVAALAPVAPIAEACCRRGYWPAPDLSRLPVPRITAADAGPYVTMGFVLADEPGGSGVALSAHRMLVLDDRHLGVWMLSGRELRRFAEQAAGAGRELPVSVNIGAPPAAVIASATAAGKLPARHDKLTLAGALAGAPLALGRGRLAGTRFFDSAEIVLEGALTGETAPEALGGLPPSISMPEFLGYHGTARAELAVLRIDAISARENAIYQSTVGPGREQSVILGLGGALALALGIGDDAAIHDLRFSHAGGGMLLLYVSLAEQTDIPRDALAALMRRMIAICPFIKTVVFVDCDVDPACEEDVLWALTTRCRLNDDCLALDGYPAVTMDPSQTDAWSVETGTEPVRTLIDATVPVALRPHTERVFA